MTIALQSFAREKQAAALACSFAVRDLYHAMYVHEPADDALDESRAFLRARLDDVAGMASDLPDSPHALHAWMNEHHATVGHKYAAYLEARKAGGPLQYFSSRAHALYFLRNVAPTKMVDGSWLYGLVHQWQDDRFHGLIKTYLEELGEGRPQDNHVVMYRHLLTSQGCEHWDDLDDELYMQGALQLSLAHNAAHFLPELIGFNLGYEQLPLHLLITAYELNELGIDPYYFTVHITVDNAGTGHARKAIDSVLSAMPMTGNRDAFYQRLKAG
nr:iron-containing redox enzyme family protein [Pseudomonas sp.]